MQAGLFRSSGHHAQRAVDYQAQPTEPTLHSVPAALQQLAA
jgi:hypothetical protein